MYIKVNGEQLEIADNSTIEDLLEKLEIPKKRLAVELNGEVLAFSSILITQLNEGDSLEVVQAIGGG
tara:strand:- start:80060 stop:80260 length:201 start_codon:yes stop_codon:yes gene_type:complete